MATVNPVIGSATPSLKWTGIVTGDTVTEAQFAAQGRYNLTISGTFAGGTVAKLLVGPTTGPTKSLPTDNTGAGTEWSTTAVTCTFVIGPLAAGTYVKPSVASGASDSVTFTLAYAGE
jgi:hypothetical protein